MVFAYRSIFALVAVALVPALPAAVAPPTVDGSAAAYAARVIGPPPASAKLDLFYRRYVDAEGIPIASSAAVPDAALLPARDIAVAMLAERPDLRRAMVASGFRVAIMATAEGTVDLPEQRDWKKPVVDDARLTICERKHYAERIGKLTDREYWNGRARGWAGC